MAPSAVAAPAPAASGMAKITTASVIGEAGIYQAAIDAAETRYKGRNERSRELHELSVNSLPGGNTRTLLHTAPFPVFMKSGEGYQVTSEDGHT
jgi:glutamate-1-semialdehyde 2,1-aminomutase